MSNMRVIMLSAMYENGGNTTHRMLDGHPELFVYPFESQVGTGYNNDFLSSYVPLRYRWPEFPTEGNPAADYEAFWDEELKTLLRVPGRSKFRDAGIVMDEARRKAAYVAWYEGRRRSRATAVEAYFHSTFEAWENVQRTGQEKAWLGYNPVQLFDTEKILADWADSHVIHVIRNPYSGYADTKKRPFPLSLERYAWTWNLCQLMAATYAERYPERFHVVRFEDLVANPAATMDGLCDRLGLARSEKTHYPSFNGQRLEQVFPWGTIRTPTPEANVATRNELSAREQAEMKSLAIVGMRLYGYENF